VTGLPSMWLHSVLSVPGHVAPAKNALFSQLFLCLSRACLGKKIVFVYINCSKRGVFRTEVVCVVTVLIDLDS
jgi:hypothetical protein